MRLVIGIEGTLSEVSPLVTSPAARHGLTLYGMLEDASWTMLSSTATASSAKEWLLREGFTRWISVRSYLDDLVEQAESGNWKASVVEQMIAENARPQYFIDSDPLAVRQVSSLGINSMLVVPPEAITRYDRDYQPWDTLVGEIEARNLRRAVRQMDAPATA